MSEAELEFDEPFIGAKGHPVPAQFFYRDGERLFVNFIGKMQSLFIPFKGKEKKCWECGGNRELVIRSDLEGDLIEVDEVCTQTLEQLNEEYHGD